MLNFTTELNLKRETELVQISSKANLRFTDTELRAAKRKPCNKENSNDQQENINSPVNQYGYQFYGPYNEAEVYSGLLKSIDLPQTYEGKLSFHNKEYTFWRDNKELLKFDSYQDLMYFSKLYPFNKSRAVIVTYFDYFSLICFNKETSIAKEYKLKVKMNDIPTIANVYLGYYYLAECPEEFKDKKSGVEPSIVDSANYEADYAKIKCSDITSSGGANPSYCTGLGGDTTTWFSYYKKELTTDMYTFNLLSRNPIKPISSRYITNTRKKVYTFEALNIGAIVLLITYHKIESTNKDSYTYLSLICLDGKKRYENITVDYSHLSKQNEELHVREVYAYTLEQCPVPPTAS